jgi:hypothetical protein
LWRGKPSLRTDETSHSTFNKLRTRTTNFIKLLRSTCRNDSRAIAYPSCPTWLMIPCGMGRYSTMMGRTTVPSISLEQNQLPLAPPQSNCLNDSRAIASCPIPISSLVPHAEGKDYPNMYPFLIYLFFVAFLHHPKNFSSTLSTTDTAPPPGVRKYTPPGSPRQPQSPPGVRKSTKPPSDPLTTSPPDTPIPTEDIFRGEANSLHYEHWLPEAL